MDKSEFIIKVNDVKVKYGNKIILSDININIRKGEIVGFLGPSGSGKTTLVKSIIGMKQVFRGTIELFGKRMPSLEVISKVGYMAQSDALYDDLSALDNILFFGELYGIRGKTAKKRALRILKLVELEKDYNLSVKKFSGGMKRRLSLAIALIHRPELLVLDEPTVGIDPMLRKKFWNEFYNIKNDGRTIIITTHAMDEAYKCDRLFLIRDGTIIAQGKPDEIIKNSGKNTIEDAFLYFSSLREGDGK